MKEYVSSAIRLKGALDDIPKRIKIKGEYYFLVIDYSKNYVGYIYQDFLMGQTTIAIAVSIARYGLCNAIHRVSQWLTDNNYNKEDRE